MKDTKRVRAHNSQEFIDDFKRVSKIMVWSRETQDFFRVRKMEVWESAKDKHISYEMSDRIFVSPQMVMVIN